MIALYHQTKTPIKFWCRQGLNLRSLIQPSETLPVELTGTHFKLLLFFFEIEFQPMASAPDDNFLLSDQDTNQFLV